MRSLIIASLLVILFFASVNAEANTEAVRSTSVSSANFKKPCCKTGCLECNRCGNVKKSTKIRRLCKIKKFSRCYNRKRCCKKITTCKGGFCKTTRRKCSWVGKKIKRFCKIIKRVTRITCSLYADPHVHGFNKKYFEAQTVGDWILYKGENLQAHYRGKSFGRWVGAVKFGVKLYNNWIFSTGFKYDTLIVNGEIRNFPAGKTKLGKGFVNRNGNKITFSTNDGEEVDFVSFGSFFNAYVRSNVEKISGICSQQFIKSKIFGHPRDGKIIKIKKVKCPKRKQHVVSCKKKGLKGGALRNCVADLCNGLPKKIEKEIIKINKKEDKKKIIKKRKQPRGTQVFCELYADPHVKGFNKRFFEAQTVGDWVLYRGDDLSAHYRGKSFGRWVGAVKFGVRLFSHKIYSVGFAFDSLIIDGVRRPIANGQTKLGKGTITRNNNKITFSTNEGEEVDFITFGSFFNGYVRSNLKSSAGICSQQFIRSHFFGHYHEGKVIKIKPQNCPNRAAFRNQCKAKGLKRGALRNCVADLCNGLDRKIERKIIRDNKIEKKKKIHIRPTPRPRPPRPVINVVHRPQPPVVHRRPPVVVRRPVFRPRPFPVRVFRRRGRGDVWLQTKSGKWIDVDDEGTFNYLLDKKNNVKIDVQFSNVGQGSVISAVSIQARGKKIVAESDGKVTVDGKPIKRKSAIFKFTKNNKVNVFKLKGKRGQFEIRGLGKERFSFEYEEETKSYMIVVGSLSKHHEGLSADPEHPEKYQLKKEESIFASYKEFKKNKPVEATEDDKKEAEKCCAKLNGDKKKECVSDFIRTGECLHYYEDKEPSLNDK